MSHELLIINGQAQMFSVRETPWHGLGHVPMDYPGRDEAMRLAGHDFKVIERPIFVAGREREASDTGFGSRIIVHGDEGIQVFGAKSGDGFKALIHSNTGDVFNVVRESYGVVQNDVIWDIVDAIVDEPNVQYETAGTLRGGAVLWVLARVGDPYWISGDDSATVPYVAVQTTHDGSGSCKASAVQTRIVCMNTKHAADAESKNSGREFTFRHTKNVMDRIKDAREALGNARAAVEAYRELAEDLATVQITSVQREEFISRFIPMPVAVTGTVITDRVENNVNEARAAVRLILNGNTTADAHRFTAYGVWQAGIEYLDHVRDAQSKDTYFNRSILGQETAKKNLAKLVREVVAA